MKTIITTLACILAFAPVALANNLKLTHQQQLDKIKADYHIPGFSVAVSSGGYKKPREYPVMYFSGKVAHNSASNIDGSTWFPIASLTKVFASYTALNLANSGRLDLDKPVADFIPEAGFPDDISIKDLLSHTLIGTGEKAFFYDPRFHLLTRIIEKAGGRAFRETLFSEVNKALDKPQLIAYEKAEVTALPEGQLLATGHEFRGQNNEIPHDYGLSAAAGLVATPKTMIDFGHYLIRSFRQEDKKHHNFIGYPQSKQYANGFFRQKIAGHSVFWSYGQYDGYAAFWMVVPDKELQIIAFSNNNLLSDASRLILGDAEASPITHFMMKNFVCENEQCDLSNLERYASIHRSVYLSRYEKAEYDAAIMAITSWLSDKDKWVSEGNLNWLHLSNYLFAVSFHMEYREPQWADKKRALIEHLLSPGSGLNPYLYFYAATFYDRLGDLQRAREYFESLLKLRNMPQHWTTGEASAWLARPPGA